MAIRFTHDAPAGIIGAFAAGQAQRRRSGSKYALDTMRRQARQQRQPQQPVFEQPEGRMLDPVSEENPFFAGMSKEDQIRQRIQQRAQRKTAARKYRLGESYSNENNLLPRFQPQAEIDAIQKQQQDEAERQRKIGREDEVFDRTIAAKKEAAALGQEGINRRAAESDKEARYAEVLDDLESGDLVLDPTVEQKIESEYKEVVKGLASLDEDGQMQAMEKFNKWKRDQLLFGARRPKKDERPRDERLQDYLGDSYEKYKDLPWVPNDKGGFELPSNLPTEKKPEETPQEVLRKKYDAAYESKFKSLHGTKDAEKGWTYDFDKADQAARAYADDVVRGVTGLHGDAGGAATQAEGAAAPQSPPEQVLTREGPQPFNPAAPMNLAPPSASSPNWNTEPPSPSGGASAEFGVNAPPAGVAPPAPHRWSPGMPVLRETESGWEHVPQEEIARRSQPHWERPGFSSSSEATGLGPSGATGAAAPAMSNRPAPRYGAPIKDYKPSSAAEESLMQKGYDRVPVLNAQGKKTGQLRWIPRSAPEPEAPSYPDGMSLPASSYVDGPAASAASSPGRQPSMTDEEIVSLFGAPDRPGVGSQAAPMALPAKPADLKVGQIYNHPKDGPVRWDGQNFLRVRR